MKHEVITAVLAVLTTTAIGTAYASNRAENDALAIANAKIGIVQAITAAEHQIGGKASRAEYEHEDGHWVFDVEVVKGDQVMDVKVDPTDGHVIAAADDKADQDHEYDKAD